MSSTNYMKMLIEFRFCPAIKSENKILIETGPEATQPAEDLRTMKILNEILIETEPNRLSQPRSPESLSL